MEGNVTFTPTLPRFLKFLSGLYVYVSYPRFLRFATYTSAPAMAMAAMTQSPGIDGVFSVGVGTGVGAAVVSGSGIMPSSTRGFAPTAIHLAFITLTEP